MNLHTITLVQQSLAQIMPEADKVAALLYRRLFELDPALRPLFPDDLTGHGRHFLAALQIGINGLSAAETIIPVIKQLGYRHAGAGVRGQDYHTFGLALLWTVAEILGADFTTEVAMAWNDAYCLLAGLMKEAVVERER